MATISDKILQYLQEHPAGADDDELRYALGLKQRQQANQCCRAMAKEGLLLREAANGNKIRNYALSAGTPIPTQNGVPAKVSDPDEPWFWEGNVQEAVRVHLEQKGCKVVQVTNPKTHQTGEDIVAEYEGIRILITAKGYPKGTKKTHPSVQAGHWFKDAVFDIIAWRGKHGKAQIAIALPDFPRYRTLAEKTTWLQSVASFAIYWVQENGDIDEMLST